MQGDCIPKPKRRCKSRPAAERFWEKVERGGPDECWPWKGARERVGYGNFWLNATDGFRKAHRVAYELTVGPIPAGMLIDHTCEFKPCCNPAHLEPVTPAGNIYRMHARGTYKNGPPPPPDPWAGMRKIGPAIRPRIERTCAYQGCQQRFEVTQATLDKGEGIYCSKRCYQRDRVRPEAERFWEKVDKHGPLPADAPEAGTCWLWTGARDTHGYGIFCIKRDGIWDQIRAHRYAWTIVNGPFREELDMCHVICDNPPCCNPAHLVPDTNAANRQHSVSKGRHARGEGHGWHTKPDRMVHGERHPCAKLTEDDVRAMRAEFEERRPRYEDLAHWYGVSTMVCWRIVNRKSWKHVP